MPTDPDELWRCGYCEKLFVVPTLARLHEAMHESEAPCVQTQQPQSSTNSAT